METMLYGIGELQMKKTADLIPVDVDQDNIIS